MSKIVYLSYDGMTDPLGESQVVQYLAQLSKQGHDISLISFEKEEAFKKHKDRIKGLLTEANINWIPLPYHKSPPVLSTLKDLRAGWKVLLKLISQNDVDIIHCRGYITALLGLRLKKKMSAIKFIFDMRGWWPDEKIDAGEWGKIFGPVYKYFKNRERDFFNYSDKTISLTEVGKSEIVQKFGLPQEKIGVVPTCVNFENFKAFDPAVRLKMRKSLNIDEDSLVMVYSGSLGGNYPIQELLSLYKNLKIYLSNLQLLIVTRTDHASIRQECQAADVSSFHVVSADYKEVGEYLMAADFGIIFYKTKYSLIGRSPTKLGEYWASGIPVISKPNIGDVESIFSKYEGGGMVMDFKSQPNVQILNHLIGTDKNALRGFAKDYFSLKKGVDFYSQVYEELDKV
ncbi:MAG: glycosyltransferase [Flavobacteriales bacterium]|nr:glycosyltransferase [Flavobacteriales bacterium]